MLPAVSKHEQPRLKKHPGSRIVTFGEFDPDVGFERKCVPAKVTFYRWVC